MRVLKLLLLSATLLVASCATDPAVPVAVSCPKPDPLPEALTKPRSPTTGADLIRRYETLIQELRDSLVKAQKQ